MLLSLLLTYITFLFKLLTLLLKLINIDDIGCRTDIGGTALLSFLYQVSIRLTSLPVLLSSSRIICNSDDKMYVGIGL